jgi:ubiquinone/menaquinone biosynthesis C-methylase UbiE
VVADGLVAAAEHVLRSVGVEAGRTCLDFGCGHGNYAVPLARMVGPAGTVYALDKDGAELDRLLERAREAGPGNVVRMDSPGGADIALDDGSVDVVLLYDVVHSHYFSADERDALFREIGRVAADRALLSVFPHHMDADEVAGEVVRRALDISFGAPREYRGPVVHDDGIIDGLVITFGRGRRST